MPRSRNRIVNNNIEFPPGYLDAIPYPDKVLVSDKTKNNGLQETYFTLSNVNDSDVDINSLDQSSSSSISWSDEFDSESTQRVQKEFERMERVLQGKEAIPPHYNRDEYELWMKTFPQLSLIGSKMKHPTQSKCLSSPSSNYEEVIAFDSDISSVVLGNCDKTFTSSDIEKIDNIKKTVIDRVFQNVSLRILKKKSENDGNNVKCSRNLETTQNLTEDFRSFLRISPILLQETSNRSHYLDTRQQSSQSVSRSERLASKWMREETNEYSSLPHLSASAKSKSRKVASIIKSRHSPNLSSRKSKCVSLPPIKTLRLPSANRFRSISATPRKPFKGSSALSVELDPVTKISKLQFEKTREILERRKNARKLQKP